MASAECEYWATTGELDAYFNLDPFPAYPTTTPTTANTTNSALPSTSPAADLLSLAQHASGASQQQAVAPSHDYELYKQQTGIPPRSLPYGMQQLALDFGLPSAGFEMLQHEQEPTQEHVNPSLLDQNLGSATLEYEYIAPARLYPGYHSNKAKTGSLQATAPPPTPSLRLDTGLPTYGAQPQQVPGRGLSQPGPATTPFTASAAPATPLAAKSHQSGIFCNTQTRQDASNFTFKAPNGVALNLDQQVLAMKQSLVHLCDPARSGMSDLTPSVPQEPEQMDEDERTLKSEAAKHMDQKKKRAIRNKVSARTFRAKKKKEAVELQMEVAQLRALATDLFKLESGRKALHELSIIYAHRKLNGQQFLPHAPTEEGPQPKRARFSSFSDETLPEALPSASHQQHPHTQPGMTGRWGLPDAPIQMQLVHNNAQPPPSNPPGGSQPPPPQGHMMLKEEHNSFFGMDL
ncbi:hypothetical protein M011DRAFT_475479 [Sporormia fimetaria CBS 119925]|uniref:BZIP domain-containing protein n=1 Tax=Sporormia fimetaria CBS 119925 TaxID=1340428 RepID=A0A6A6VFL2_9PLEO|nr:hypothetical protein M011DRAFT_475479 [Sporormia fimetaria CBS 119925]